jgi:hypothetical protein
LLKFLDATLSTEERTWQALAWETSARVALVESGTFVVVGGCP